jgi:hypothetical protein
MKTFVKLFLLLAFVHGLVILPQTHTTAELIEPTRTLKGESALPGRLSVFSEPPELGVEVDGNPIGSTPLVELKIEPGVHTVRIVETQKEIMVESGKLLQLSFHRGEFIVIPQKASMDSDRKVVKPSDEGDPSALKQKAGDTRTFEQPFYWPLNPDGPIDPNWR